MDDASRPSYSNGPSDQPLIGETIGANLERTAAAFGDREALVDVPSGRRWTYARLNADADALASGLIAAGIAAGRPGGHLGAQLPGVGAAAVRHREDRRDPGQHQPGLPQPRAGLRAVASPA